LVLEKGEVKEYGDHFSLMAKKGAYYNLYNMQFSKEALI